MSKVIITRLNDIKPKRVSKHPKYQYTRYKVTDRSDFNQCFVAFYEIEPGSYNYPMHYHENNTEAFYIISGEGLLLTNKEETPIKSGDVIVCPPGENGVHQIKNTSSKDKLIYIDFDAISSPDVVHYPKTNKVGVIIHNKSADFYMNDSKVDYYEGE